MPKPLTELGKALEAHRIAAGLTKRKVAERLGNRSRTLWDRTITAERPPVETLERVTAAVQFDQDRALRLAGYDPELVAKLRTTRQQPEQQQQAEQLAG